MRVINLEVRATDRSGRPVNDLRADELTLEVDGKPVPLGHFARIADGRSVIPPATPDGTVTAPVTSAASTATAGSAPLRVAILIDDFFLGPASRKRAASAIRPFLEHELAPDVEVLLAGFDRRGLAVRVPFTRDRQKVITAIESATLATESVRRESDLASTMLTLRGAAARPDRKSDHRPAAVRP